MTDVRIQDFARIGVVTYTAYPALLTGGITMAQVIDEVGADEYFDSVEVTWISDDAARAKAIEAADASSLSVVFDAQPYLLARKLNLAALDGNARNEAVKVCRQAIDQAVTWDASAFALLSGRDPGQAQRPAAFEQLARSLAELCDYAGSKGNMPVLLETYDRQPFGTNQLVGPTVEALELAGKVRAGHKNFGLMLDLGGLVLLEESVAQALDLVKDLLGAVHISNCVMRDAGHPAYGRGRPPLGIPAGEVGAVQLTDFLKELFRVGFLGGECVRLGQISLDVGPLARQNPAEVIGQTKEMLQTAFQEVQPPQATAQPQAEENLA